jgi:vacuolar-type H+-ATPase subunit I/STV1
MARTTVENQLAAIRKQRELLDKKEQALKSKSHEKVLAKIVALAKDAVLANQPRRVKYLRQLRRALWQVKKSHQNTATQQIQSKLGPVVVFRQLGCKHSKPRVLWIRH